MKHLEDASTVTCSTSFLKGQPQKGEEAADNVSCMVPSLVLSPSAILHSNWPAGAC